MNVLDYLALETRRIEISIDLGKLAEREALVRATLYAERGSAEQAKAIDILALYDEDLEYLAAQVAQAERDADARYDDPPHTRYEPSEAWFSPGY